MAERSAVHSCWSQALSGCSFDGVAADEFVDPDLIQGAMEQAEYATMFRVEETHWWYRAQHQLIFQTLNAEMPNWRDKKILDAGCGTGAILQQLGSPERNWGIDLAPESIEFCRKRGLTNVRHGDVNALPFDDASFDAVISSSVIYHDWVPNVARALQ